MVSFALAIIILAANVDALTVYHSKQARSRSQAFNNADPKAQVTTFPAYYEQHTSGRGVWKWDNALVAYQRHFGTLMGKPLAIAEVGVQSGGSLLMWKNVLGSQIKLYGLDINPACEQFTEPNVSITIGDQGDWKMWQGFFQKNSAGLDILVDDGGHEPHQMLTTLQSAFPHIHPGGYICIEDITNAWYLKPFFLPTATYLGQMSQQGLIESVHIYPMLLVVRRVGSPDPSLGALTFSDKQTKVANLTAMWTAISTVAPGSHILLQNPAWDDLFNVDSLANMFSGFIGLHDAAFKDSPKGCSTSVAPVCTNEIKPLTHLQSRVSGVHIYKDHAIIEIPATPPRLAAVRKGTKWISYSG